MSKSKIDQKTNHDDGDNNASVRNMKKKKNNQEKVKNTQRLQMVMCTVQCTLLYDQKRYMCAQTISLHCIIHRPKPF